MVLPAPPSGGQIDPTTAKPYITKLHGILSYLF